MSLEADYTLDNGLRVFIQESHVAPVVAVQIWVNAGSADERPEEAGIAHVLEHMMFKGTPQRKVGEIAQAVERAGGDINAFTSFDQTVFHVTMASRFFGLGLDVLGDAVQASLFDADELKMEKEVVLEEVRRYLDVPARQLSQALFQTVFTTHPYGRPVIGFEDTVRGFERADVLAFYQRWYRPDNITVVVVGDVTIAQAKAEVEKVFGGFTREGPPKAARAVEPEQEAPRCVSLVQEVQEGHLELAFPTVAAKSGDAPYLDLMALILGQGESSRLVQRVRNEKQLVNGVYAYAYSPREPGMFMVGATLEPGKLTQAYEAILEEIQGMVAAPVRALELRKARTIIESDAIHERETVDGRARKFGYFLQNFGSLDQDREYHRIIHEATPQRLWEVAQRYLRADRLTVGVLVGEEADLPNSEGLKDTAQGILSGATAGGQAPAIIGNAREGETVRVVLSNGARLLVKENHAVPLVAVRALFLGGLRCEQARYNGAFNLLGNMMTRGTARRSAYEIAHEVESLAGGMGGMAGRNSFGLRAEFLSEHLERGMEVFGEILREPAFAEDELEKIKRLTLESIRNQQDHPSSYVFRRFAEKMYRRHPFRLPMQGTEASLARLSRGVIQRTYERFATAENLVLSVVGDVDVRDMQALMEQHLADFRGGAARMPEIPVEPPLTRSRRIHSHNDKQQLHMVLGWRGVTLESSDRFAMDVLSSVLSGQGGRLFLELRDKQGLAYSVAPVLVSALGEGFFGIYIGTEPSKYAQARKGILTEVGRLLADGVTEEELARTKTHMVGTFEIELQRSSPLCSNIAFNELYGLGYDGYRRYAERIHGVTRDQVLAVARRYLNTDVFVESVVGPLENQEGAQE